MSLVVVELNSNEWFEAVRVKFSFSDYIFHIFLVSVYLEEIKVFAQK